MQETILPNEFRLMCRVDDDRMPACGKEANGIHHLHVWKTELIFSLKSVILAYHTIDIKCDGQQLFRLRFHKFIVPQALM